MTEENNAPPAITVQPGKPVIDLPKPKKPSSHRRPRSSQEHPRDGQRPRQTSLSLPDQSNTHCSPPEHTEAPPESRSHDIVWVDGNTAGKEGGNTGLDPLESNIGNQPTAMATTYTRRNANGTVGSVYSGNKIRHLKKEDGIPLWRKDIQLEFLRCVFENDQKCFTMPSDSTRGHSFADIYIDTMARSSKSSKVLKEKLLADRAGAMSMAMICLLVNVGRMNTTLNFFPEMRAQLRTFHAIPSLQANQDPNAYKQLQDAPRLKSILKGASEDLNQPNTLEKLKNFPAPRTNPVHLVFLLSQYAPKVSEAHFQPPRDFFDLVMRSTLSSKSRARAFLWLIWWYLESDFTKEAATNNPFGEGQYGEGTESLPIKVPVFEHLTESQADAENVDTEEEKKYGEMKRLERKRILDDDETVGPPSKKQRKGHDETIVAISDTDPTRSPSPSNIHRKVSTDQTNAGVLAPNQVIENGISQNRYPNIASKLESSNPQRLILKTKIESSTDASSPVPAITGHATWNTKRTRQETSHQKAVNLNRKMHVDHILYKQMASHQLELRKEKRRKSSTFGMMVLNRLKELPDMYDTDDEDSWGPGGLVPDSKERDDFGEEATRYKKVIDRAIRRLDRATHGAPTGVLKGYERKKELLPNANNRVGLGPPRPKKNGMVKQVREGATRHAQDQEHQLDDLDLELLGVNREDDQEDESASDETEPDDADLTDDDVDLQA